MTRPPGDDRLARAALTYLAEPADPLLGELLRILDPSGFLAFIRSGAVRAGVADELAPYLADRLRATLAQWHALIPAIPPDAATRHEASGIRLLCPDEPE